MSFPLPPFAFASESEAFERRWLEEIPRRLYELQIQQLPERNILKYQHGRGWTFNDTEGTEVPGEFREHSNMFKVDADSRRNCEIEKLAALAEESARNFAAAAEQSMMKVVEETTDKTGNIVQWTAEQQNAPAAYLKMLKMVEFSVTPDGKVSRPSLYKVPPAFMAQLQHELVNNPVFAAEVARVNAQKTTEALAREKLRKAKFAQPS